MEDLEYKLDYITKKVKYLVANRSRPGLYLMMLIAMVAGVRACNNSENIEEKLDVLMTSARIEKEEFYCSQKHSITRYYKMGEFGNKFYLDDKKCE